jgi:hypothetical protein
MFLKRNRRTQIPIRILFQVLQRLKNQCLFLLFHSITIASAYRLFLVSVIGVRIFSILDSGLKFSGKKVILNYWGSLALYLVEMDSDPEK